MDRKNKFLLMFLFVFLNIKPMTSDISKNTEVFIWFIKEGRKRFPHGSTRNNIKRMLKLLEEKEKSKKD
jgi:hypothetical protein